VGDTEPREAAKATWDDPGEITAKIVAEWKKYVGRSLRRTGPRTTSISEIAKILEEETGWKVNLRFLGGKKRDDTTLRGRAQARVVTGWLRAEAGGSRG
jgi:hypothetical protein